MSSYVSINSVHRTSGSSHAYSVSLNRFIKNVKRISLTHLEIPNTFYTIRTGYNRIIQFVLNNVTYTSNIGIGSYTITTLLQEIQTSWDPVLSGVTLTATDSKTNKVTITSPNTITIVDGTLARQLGFTAGQTGTTILATNRFSIGDTHFFIRISNLPSSMVSSVNAHYRIQLSADNGYIQFYDSESNPQTIDLDGNTTLGHLDISLVDSVGNVLSLNGAEWSMLLKVDHDDN